MANHKIKRTSLGASRRWRRAVGRSNSGGLVGLISRAFRLEDSWMLSVATEQCVKPVDEPREAYPPELSG